MSETQQRNEGGAKEQALCRFIIHELHTTEQSYCRLLQMIYTNYMRPMEVALQAKDPLTIKKSNDILVLFCHLPQLLQLSERFLDQFTEIDLDTVINTFTALQDDFAIFLRYAVHYRSNWKSIRKACRSNALFLNIDQECLARKETNRLGMADYLIAPIQRVPRYCLLLKDLLRYTSKCDPRYPALESVLLKMMSLAAVMDKDKRRAL
ncbi:Dbl homology domain-containing protein [Syncephalastrum racemosum]|uniref:Dbl homology domain-containing protein n=1 Tax=Syncephalastrum racemosum TaxID=13706 RepID=A0A1X2HQ25_SYNRA|nr:Dbl homology domain-containing protein [Syncephalastrum racemosum]